MTVVSCLVGALTAGACAAGGWALLYDDPAPRQEHTDQDTVPRDTGPDALDSRETDPEPLTLNEFVVDDAVGGHRLLDGEELDDCAGAVTDGLVAALEEADCSQAVRATVVDADEVFVATVGVVNLRDSSSAEALRARIAEGPDGGFTALRTDGAGSDLGLASTVLGFAAHGHYLVYAVIGRVDGGTPSLDDPAVAEMVGVLVDDALPSALEDRVA